MNKIIKITYPTVEQAAKLKERGDNRKFYFASMHLAQYYVESDKGTVCDLGKVDFDGYKYAVEFISDEFGNRNELFKTKKDAVEYITKMLNKYAH